MSEVGNENELIADAQQVIGDGETVRKAGVFGLQDLMHPMIAGQTVGALAGHALAGTEGAVAGVLLGGLLARKAAAEERGVTLKLIVAVTDTKVHVLNWDNDQENRLVATFDRATTTVTVKHFGLSRIVTIDDSATETQMKLHASASRVMAQSGPDADVLTELTRSE